MGVFLFGAAFLQSKGVRLRAAIFIGIDASGEIPGASIILYSAALPAAPPCPQLLRVGSIIQAAFVDANDNTPALDIKPYALRMAEKHRGIGRF